MAMNDPRERDLWLETWSRIDRAPTPRRFATRQLTVLVALIAIGALAYFVLRLN